MAEPTTIKIEPSSEFIELVKQMKEVGETFKGVKVQVLKPKPGSTIAISRPQDSACLSESGRANIYSICKILWPDCEVVVFEEGMKIDSIVEVQHD